MIIVLGPPDKKGTDEILDADHYVADSGEIYARSRKQRTSRPGTMMYCNTLLLFTMVTGSGHDRKPAAREMDRKKSPPSHWYNGVAEGSYDNHARAHHRRYIDTTLPNMDII